MDSITLTNIDYDNSVSPIGYYYSEKGNKVDIWSYKAWREFSDIIVPKRGIILSKNKQRLCKK